MLLCQFVQLLSPHESSLRPVLGVLLATMEVLVPILLHCHILPLQELCLVRLLLGEFWVEGNVGGEVSWVCNRVTIGLGSLRALQ